MSKEPWPIQAGQIWRDRDSRSRVRVRVVRVENARVYYVRGGFARLRGPEHHTCSTKVDAFPRRFEFVPPADLSEGS